MGQPIQNRRPSLEVAKDLIAVKRQILPLQEKEEGLKEEIRQYGANKYITDHGYITVSEPEVRTFKGAVPVVNAEAFLALPANEQAQLVRLGVVKWEDQYTRNAKSKVETVPV